MKKKELLAPAGDLESLYQAVCNGADAVYIGGKNFGARKFANNFSLEEIKIGVRYCHLYGVKLYVTVNTLVYDDEVEDFISYIKYLNSICVDAVIMQDIGMICLVHKMFPELEIHASTQLHNMNEEKFKLLADIGVKRVVLARELSIDQIDRINTDLEKEVFIHGAICISYSGLCLFSSVILNRSGNRGECAGFCRLPYELYKDNKRINTDGKYLLSAKELSSINNLKEILDSNVSSLKIEGRMKSSLYVGFITRLYRMLIDKYYDGLDLSITESEYNDLCNLFNRKFTKGYINNESNNNLINRDSPNHIGTYLGEVINFTKDKICIKLSSNLCQNDGIRFNNGNGFIVNYLYNKEGLLINKASTGEIVFVDNKINLRSLGDVRKTSDFNLLKNLKILPKRYIDIDVNIYALVNKKLKISFSKGDKEVSEEGEVVSLSKNRPVSKDDILNKISKLGDTSFKINNININMDKDIFIPISCINDIRRKLCLKLINALEDRPVKKIGNIENNSKDMEVTKRISFLVRSKEQLEALIDKDVDIYIEDCKLYNEYKSFSNVYFRTYRVPLKVLRFSNSNILSSSLESIYFNRDNNVNTCIYLNVVNCYSINFLANLGVKRIGLSVEIDNDRLKNIVSLYKKIFGTNVNLEILVYGKIEVMALKYCILNDIVNNKKVCDVCKNGVYKLKDRNGKYYDIHNVNCTNYLLNYKSLNNIEKIVDYKKYGITNYRVDLFSESYDETINLYQKIAKIL